MTHAETSAPVLDPAPETPSTPVTEVAGNRDVFEIRVPWEDPSPAEEATEAPAETEPAKDPEAPAAPAINLADLTDEHFAELEKDPRFKGRIERRVANEYGNRLQQERAAAAAEAVRNAQAEAEARQEASKAYANLQAIREEDPERYKEILDEIDPKSGRPAVRDWIAAYEKLEADEIAERNRPAQQGDADAVRTTMEAVKNAFPQVTKAVLGEMFDALPEASRRGLEAAANSESWFEDGLKAVVQGIEEKHRKALADAVKEARQAGRNEALAERGDELPMQVSGRADPPRDADDIVRRYADGRATREEFAWAKKQKGWDW